MRFMHYSFPYAAYLAGGCALAVLGPMFWGVSSLIAALAAFATTVVFSTGHAIFAMIRKLNEHAQNDKCQNASIEALQRELETHRNHVRNAGRQTDPEMMHELREALMLLTRKLGPVQAQPVAGSSPLPPSQQLVRDALDQSRIDLHLQPVVQLPTRATVHYEAFSRLRDAAGRVILPSEFMPAVSAAGIAGSFDSFQLARCIVVARKIANKGRHGQVFCNLAARSLNDASFRDELQRYLGQHVELAGRLVFELSAREVSGLDPEAIITLERLAGLGYALSVDRLNVDDMADVMMRLPSLRYAKIDADLLLGASSTQLRDLRLRGAHVIASRVENERQVIELMDLGITLAQGYLFGHPRPARIVDEAETALEKRAAA